MVKDELNKDSSISKITMQLPVKSQLHKAHLPVPAHKTFTFISPTLDSCAYNGPKEYWKLGSVLVQKVRLKKDLVHVEGNAYSHEWVIAGKGKSSRRLVWYLSPEPRYP